MSGEFRAASGLAARFGSELAAWLPEEYAAYRPLVADALVFFLGRLSAQRLAGLVGEQLALAVTTSPAQRTVALLRHCPTLHKLGQVVARDRRLAPELRARLQGLESLPPTIPVAALLPGLRRELGSLAGLTIAGAALAEGSVALVVPFAGQLESVPVEGVFKVLKPGVEARLLEELEIWSTLGAYLEQRSAELELPPLDYRETADSVRRLLLNEIRPEVEQAQLAAAASVYAPPVRIPRLLPWCTPRLTAMERIDGVKVTAASAADRRRLAPIAVEALLARPFWSAAPRAVFHADPHAGNLLATAGGELAIIDWSLTAELAKAEREAIVRLVLAALAQDAPALCRGLAALGRGVPAEAVLREAVAEALREVRQGRFPGLSWTLDLADRLATRAGMGFSEPLLLLRKAAYTLAGVLADLAPECSADAVLAETGLVQFLRDLGGRAGAAFDSRALGCHVSSADLLALWLDAPASVGRYWQGLWHDAWTAPAIVRR